MSYTNQSNTNNQFTYLQQQAHIDLTLRARGGIFIYFVVWIITAIWADIIHSNQLLFITNTALFFIVSILRSLHYKRITQMPSSNTRIMYNAIVTIILLSALHWGGLSAIIIFSGDYDTLHYPYMIIIAAFAVGGTGVLSISRAISILYPMCIFVPTLIAGLIIGGTENYVLVILAVLSVLYVLEASRVSHNDYHKAIYSHKVAENRAVQMEQLSITDQLTNLKNRMFFNKQYSDMWLCCSRHQAPLSVIMIDLDHFKRINDTYGHISGDKCLKKVAAVLTYEIRRTTDTVARFGGEEFVVLLPETNLETSSKIAQRLLQSISEIDLVFNKEKVPITCSIGLACVIPDHSLGDEDLIIAADKALYQAKTNGRNQCCIATEISKLSI